MRYPPHSHLSMHPPSCGLHGATQARFPVDQDTASYLGLGITCPTPQPSNRETLGLGSVSRWQTPSAWIEAGVAGRACYRSSMAKYLPVPEADDATDATSSSHVLHVRGVRAGPQAVADLTRIFSHFGKVKDVVVREKFSTPEGSEPDAPTVDTSWALVTMSSNAAVAAALRDEVHERMDPSRPLKLSRFNRAIAETSTGAMTAVKLRTSKSHDFEAGGTLDQSIQIAAGPEKDATLASDEL